MNYTVEKRDLFTLTDTHYLAHCISSDFGMGAGIAVQFNKRFNMREKLLLDFPNGWIDDKGHGYIGVIVEDNVFNLVTKEKYWHKPTYSTITRSLVDMRDYCELHDINKIAMPKIGCGLDRLQWNKVENIIKDIFKETDIEILVCEL